MSEPDLDGWVPIRVYWCGAEPIVDWCYLGEQRFTEPFFEQTITIALREPATLLFRHQTSLDALEQRVAERPGVPPAGFIFHLSRCGSTLLAQMLAALPQCLVLSEASPIDAILRAAQHDPRYTDAQRIRWLRWVVSALSQPRGGTAQACFIKFDCWNIHELALVEQAFPAVPWIFLYRDPVEVLVSHQRQRGPQMVPALLDPQVFGLAPAEIAALSLDAYAARVLGRICEAALLHYRPSAGRLVHYRQLPGFALDALPEWFNLPLTVADRARMEAVAAFNAKNPTLLFSPDAQAKQHAADAELRTLAERWVGPAYRALEQRGAAGC